MRMRLFSLLLIITGAASADETMYVQSASAKLLSDKSFSSAIVLEIHKGEAIKVKSTSGRWTEAVYKNKSGWISTLLLAKNPPLEKVTVITEDAALGNNARRRASTVATAGATRGLTSDNRQRANEDVTINRRAVLKLEQSDISASELAQFRKELFK